MTDREGKDPTQDARKTGARHDPDDGVDVTLVRWTLRLTPSERLVILQGSVDAIVDLRSRLGAR
jgi:hypothetical protein